MSGFRCVLADRPPPEPEQRGRAPPAPPRFEVSHGGVKHRWWGAPSRAFSLVGRPASGVSRVWKSQNEIVLEILQELIVRMFYKMINIMVLHTTYPQKWFYDICSE